MAFTLLLIAIAFAVAAWLVAGCFVFFVWRRDAARPDYHLSNKGPLDKWEMWVEDRYIFVSEFIEEPQWIFGFAAFPLLTPIFELGLLLFTAADKLMTKFEPKS